MSLHSRHSSHDPPVTAFSTLQSLCRRRLHRWEVRWPSVCTSARSWWRLQRLLHDTGTKYSHDALFLQPRLCRSCRYYTVVGHMGTRTCARLLESAVRMMAAILHEMLAIYVHMKSYDLPNTALSTVLFLYVRRRDLYEARERDGGSSGGSCTKHSIHVTWVSVFAAGHQLRPC